MLPRPIRRGCGRGAGSTSQYPDAAPPTALILADEATQGRSRHYGTMAVFAASLRKSELFVDETAVRAAITWFLRRSERAVDRALEADPDDGLYRMADKIKAKTSVYDPAIIHLTNPNAAADPTRNATRCAGPQEAGELEVAAPVLRHVGRGVRDHRRRVRRRLRRRGLVR